METNRKPREHHGPRTVRNDLAKNGSALPNQPNEPPAKALNLGDAGVQSREFWFTSTDGSPIACQRWDGRLMAPIRSAIRGTPRDAFGSARYGVSRTGSSTYSGRVDRIRYSWPAGHDGVAS